MKFVTKVVSTLALVAMSAVGFAGNEDLYSPDDRDTSTMMEFLSEKEMIDLKEKSKNLLITGDARIRGVSRSQVFDGRKQVGSGSGGHVSEGNPTGTPAGAPAHLYKAEFNLYMDYKADSAWVSTKIRFKDYMGEQDRSNYNTNYASTTELQRLYVGYNIIEDGAAVFDVEIGRQKLGDLFDSIVEFDSVFDGLAFGYWNSFSGVGDFSARAGVFIIDNLYNQYGFAGQVALENVADTGFFAKYSYIDWSKGGQTDFILADGTHVTQSNNPYWLYQVSQILAGYNFNPSMIGVPVTAYAAYLVNTAARGQTATQSQKLNTGYYFGVTFGSLDNVGDWTLDVNYQYVGAQCVRGGDIAGIGRVEYNPGDLYNLGTNGNYGGKSNYKGIEATGMIAVTENFNLYAQYQAAVNIKKFVNGSKSNYKKVEAGVGYTF